MPLVTTKKLLSDAQEGQCAVGAFNIENMEMVQAVTAAAVEESGVYAALHLEHGSSYELAVQAALAGYTSIMIDGSPKPFEENIEVTRKVVEMCSSD